MEIELYPDRVIVSIWNAEENEVEDYHEFNDDSDCGGLSHKAQVKKLFSHWCPSCTCAFRKSDMETLTELGNPKCPMCGTELEIFDLDRIVREAEDDSWMFPDGHDDGESIDELPCDK